MLAVPMMIQNGITNMVSLIDNVMVGKLGTEAMTAVSIAGQLIFVFSLAIFGGLSGPGIFGAQFFGQGNTEGIKNSFRMKMIIAVVTEELAHIEMISAILYQLTRNLTIDKIKKGGFDTYFVDHTTGIYPVAASGMPFTATYFQSKGDIIIDLNEDLAAEQKARTTYDNILRFADDSDVRDPIKYLRQRELVHYQRFGEALRLATDNLDSKNFYAFNPEFDK